MVNGEQPKEIKDRESFIRWQGRTIEQFGYTLNLILTISVATLGFEISLLLDKTFERANWQNCIFILSMLLVFLSVALGLVCIVNRLHDFRATAKTAYNRKNGASDLELQLLRMLTRTLGERTWLLFWWQVTTFGAGILLLVFAFVGTAVKLVSM